MERFAPFRLTAFGTFPILRPIFHKMKNAGRVILEECKGQARRTAECSHEQFIYCDAQPSVIAYGDDSSLAGSI